MRPRRNSVLQPQTLFEKYCNRDKPAMLNFYSMALLTPAFREELYRLSRIKFGG
jgi:hypothetical protein